MERGKSGEAGPGCRGKPFGSFLAFEKGTRLGRRNQKHPQNSAINLAQSVLATLNADIANSFAKQAEGLPRAASWGPLCCPWRMNSLLQGGRLATPRTA
ncbi:hypothetical protein D3C77_595270 [compost metagenome]